MSYLPADPLLDGRLLRAALQTIALPSRRVQPPTGLHLFESGRTALWAALRSLGIGRGDRLLLPAYICDSVLPAAAALGVEVRYVPTSRDLKPDLDALSSELREGARAVLVAHYFGFPAPGLAKVASICQRFGAALIEDCAHLPITQAELGAFGRIGAAAVFSLWKLLALPDGGGLLLNGRRLPSDVAALPRPGQLQTLQRLVYRAASVVEPGLGRSPRLWLLRSDRLRKAMQARVAQAPLVPRQSSLTAVAMLAVTDWDWIIARRRENYRRVNAAMSDLTWAAPLFPDLPVEACPLGYPILAAKRESARRRLLAAGINVRAYWERLPAAVRSERYADANYVSDHVLVLPVHQSLTAAQMSHLERALVALERA